jgi:hypothetical protein
MPVRYRWVLGASAWTEGAADGRLDRLAPSLALFAEGTGRLGRERHRGLWPAGLNHPHSSRG